MRKPAFTYMGPGQDGYHYLISLMADDIGLPVALIPSLWIDAEQRTKDIVKVLNLALNSAPQAELDSLWGHLEAACCFT